MSTENHERLERLSDAVTAYLQFKAAGGTDEAGFLSEHADLHDLLGPMLEADGADQAGTRQSAESGGFDPLAPLPAAGRILDDFRIVREIGRGGMGIVYEAQQISLKRPVALKILPQSLGLPAVRIERFRREAAAAARLNHPGILPVYCVGEAEGTHFFAMELVDGPSLHEVLADARAGRTGAGLGVIDGLSRVAEVVELVAQIAAGLAEAHANGVIHRDIKPHNILIDRRAGRVEGRTGRPEDSRGDSSEARFDSASASRVRRRQCARIVDFGLAKDLDQVTVSLTGDVAGTPQYMSPEQVAGLHRVDERTDIFSLGVVMYECLILDAPFQGETTQRVLHAVVHTEPRPLRAVDPGIPVDVEVICAKAMEKNAADRYASARDFADDLRRFLAHEPILARPPGPWRRAVKAARRHPVIAGAVAMGVLLVSLGSGGYLTHLELSNRALAREQAATERQRDRALANLRGAQAVLNRMLENVEKLASRPGLESFQRRMAEDVVQHLDALRRDDQGAENDRDLEFDLLAARARVRLAKTYFWVGERAAALGQMDVAERTVAALQQRAPGDRRARAYAATNAVARALILTDAGDVGIAVRKFEEAASICRELAATEPDAALRRDHTMRGVEAALHHAGLLIGNGRGGADNVKRASRLLDAAQQELDRVEAAVGGGAGKLAGDAGELGERLRLRYLLQSTRAWVGRAAGESAAATDAVRASVATARARLVQSPELPRIKRDLAIALRSQGQLAATGGDREQALRCFGAAATSLQELVRDFPKTRSFRGELATALLLAASLSGELGRYQEARQRIDAAHEHALAIGDSWGDGGRRLVARCQVVDGLVLLASGGATADFAAVRRLIQRGIAGHQDLVTRHPDATGFRADLAYALQQLAICERRAGDLEASRAAIDRAIDNQLEATRLNPKQAGLRHWLRLQLGFSAELLVWKGDHAGAAKASERLLQHAEDDGRAVLSAATNLANCMHWAAADQMVADADRAGILAQYGAASLAALRRAVGLGYRGAARLRRQKDFALLRPHAGFQALLREIDRLRAEDQGKDK